MKVLKYNLFIQRSNVTFRTLHLGADLLELPCDMRNVHPSHLLAFTSGHTQVFFQSFEFTVMVHISESRTIPASPGAASEVLFWSA